MTKYYFKDIKWAWTLDGDFVMPFIENTEGDKLKNLLTGDVIEFRMNNHKYKYSAKCKAIMEKYELGSRPDMQIMGSLDLLFDGELINRLIPLRTKIKYGFSSGDAENKNQVVKEMAWLEVDEKQLQKTANRMQFILYRNHKKYEKNKIKADKQQCKRTEKKKQVEAKGKPEEEVRESTRSMYMDF